jgi:hypothetical protein
MNTSIPRDLLLETIRNTRKLELRRKRYQTDAVTRHKRNLASLLAYQKNREVHKAKMRAYMVKRRRERREANA